MPPGPHPSIVMTPPSGTRPVAAIAHPRRQPAHRSVSLLHSPRKRPSPLSNESTEQQKGDSDGTDDSPSSLQPLGGKGSSGESSSNAEKWFENSNNDVQDNPSSFADNEPPYFFRNNSSSSDTSPERRGLLQKAMAVQRQMLDPNDGTGSLPMRAGLLHLGTDGSSTDDFRGVIDDLTIENKKLKRKLKKYEKLHDSHLKDEKLFEVRIHGLPPEKKRELEETLRKFAGSLGPAEFPVNGYEGLAPLLKTHKTASSQTSLQNPDSAYASLSASGQGSSAHSATDSRQRHPASSAARQHSIHTYLHHIPEGLLPHPNPANMTERAKKKLVVRRLEQIFAGKGATSDGHQQPLQQQEVSQSAALADRSATEARGQHVRQEGNREAHIMSQAAEEGGGTGKRHDAQEISPSQHQEEPRTAPVMGGKDLDLSSPHALDQRPTRPLDLDPHRAQVPSENIRYMRHLGFSPPDPDSHTGLADGHGWIYLNFLINMAQLHTINVTSDFVRKAISELSNNFDISPDGRKVRWKSGHGATRTSSDAGSSYATGSNTPGGQSPRKRPKLLHRTSNKSSGQQAQSGAAVGKESNRFAYTPLFFHKDSTDGGDDSTSEEEEEDESALYPGPVAGDSSGMTSSGVRTTSTKKSKKAEEGPIIFYNNARFCTDLSGERKPLGGNPNAPPYNPFSNHPIGKPRTPSPPASEKRGPLAEAADLPEAMDLRDNPIPESMEIAFPPSSPFDSDSADGRASVNLEVTGIGGVWPADHFAINVQSRHVRVDQSSPPTAAQQVPAKSLPPRFASILRGADARIAKGPAISKQVLSSSRRDLEPSQLPPALSFMPFGEESLSDDESDGEDGMSLSPESPGAFPPSAAPQAIDMLYGDSGEESEEEDDDDAESEGSLDLLAAAREVDPEAVLAREREYDANMADRLAEEIPAGSSAATAGGGSGYASPASGAGGHDVAHEQYQRAKREARPRPASLKRVRTSDSMRVQGQEASENEDESDAGSDEDMDDAKS